METILVSDSAHILSSKLFKRHFPKVSSTIRNILPKIARCAVWCGKNKIFRFEVDVMISSFPCHTAGRFHAVRNALCDLRCPASLRLSSNHHSFLASWFGLVCALCKTTTLLLRCLRCSLVQGEGRRGRGRGRHYTMRVIMRLSFSTVYKGSCFYDQSCCALIAIATGSRRKMIKELFWEQRLWWLWLTMTTTALNFRRQAGL